MPFLSKGFAAEKRRIKAAQEASWAAQRQDRKSTETISDSSDGPSCNPFIDISFDEEREYSRACLLQGRAIRQKSSDRVALDNVEECCSGLVIAIHDVILCKVVNNECCQSTQTSKR